MKKIMCLMLMVALFSILAWSACAKPAPPAAQPAPPAAKPAPAPTTRARVDIKILTAKLGSGGYATGAGWADLINKNSSWLRASVLETGGCPDNIRIGYDDPKERALCLRWWIESQTHLSRLGAPPYDKKYTGQKAIIFGYAGTNAPFTIDPNIKTAKDFIGKKVATGARGSSLWETGEFILGDVWGIRDKVSAVFLSFGEAKDALMDGTIHAMMGTITLVGPNQWKIHESLVEPWETKPGAHFISLAREETERAIKAKDLPYGYLACPKGALGAKQTEEWGGQSYHLYWGAYPEMPNDVAYEITRIAYEYANQIGNYFPAEKSFTHDTMAWFPVVHKSEDEVHPGALKFYKERNVKIYLGGSNPPLY